VAAFAKVNLSQALDPTGNRYRVRWGGNMSRKNWRRLCRAHGWSIRTPKPLRPKTYVTGLPDDDKVELGIRESDDNFDGFPECYPDLLFWVNNYQTDDSEVDSEQTDWSWGLNSDDHPSSDPDEAPEPQPGPSQPAEGTSERLPDFVPVLATQPKSNGSRPSNIARAAAILAAEAARDAFETDADDESSDDEREAAPRIGPKRPRTPDSSDYE
jgi:hypothetical protein